MSLDGRLESLSSQLGNGVVVMAGAGVSAGPPTCLPGWFAFNKLVLNALCTRVDDYFQRSGYTADLKAALDRRRDDRAFPPDYQAQVLHEYAGDAYFRAIPALDVDVRSDSHETIAWLAEKGVLAAVVTTNFDRLIEQALGDRGVQYFAAFEPEGYQAALKMIERGERSPLPVLKVHGCVSDVASVIDTMQQRLLGRDADLEKAIGLLVRRHYWVFSGFSADDLADDKDYLQIAPNAARSPGCLYLSWRDAADLTPGSVRLLDAFGAGGAREVASLAELCAALAQRMDWGPPPKASSDETASSVEIVGERLADWASSLHPAVAVCCIAGLAEAGGHTETAFDLMRRNWDEFLSDDRKGPEFDRYRLLHGRLGIGRGLMSFEADLGSDAGMESLQDLLRVASRSRLSSALFCLGQLWAGRSGAAIKMVGEHLNGFSEAGARSREEIDIWLACAETAYMISFAEFASVTWENVATSAKAMGELPRQALVTTLAALHMAEHDPDSYEEFAQRHVAPLLDRCERLHVPDVIAFAELARGRFHTRRLNGEKALDPLKRAHDAFRRAARPPWRILSAIHYAKALMDTKRLDDADALLDEIAEDVGRYPILEIWFLEARGMWNRMVGSDRKYAVQCFEMGLERAQKFGLVRRAEVMSKYLDMVREDPSSDTGDEHVEGGQTS